MLQQRQKQRMWYFCTWSLEASTVQAVLTDWQTAPVDEKVRTTLQFLEKLTRFPNDVTEEDLSPMLEAGVSKEGIEEANREQAL